jgi:hypothetical protein
VTSIHYAAIITFPAVFCALYAAHQVGDHWVQTHRQARSKGQQNGAGQMTCFTHVVWLAVTKLAALYALYLFFGLPLNVWTLTVGLLVDGASHYWADRAAAHPDKEHPVTLQRLAERIGKGDFYRMGAGHLGSGAYALDQAWHVGWLFITSLIISGGS